MRIKVRSVVMLVLAVSFGSVMADPVSNGAYIKIGHATNVVVSGLSTGGGTVSYGSTPDRADGGIATILGAGQATFNNVNDKLIYKFRYLDIVMNYNGVTPIFRTGFDFGSSAVVYHATSTGSQPNLDFFANDNGNPFSMGTQVGARVTGWSPFALQHLRFRTGETIDGTVSLTMTADHGNGTYDYLYEVAYQEVGGADYNYASQVFAGVAGNNVDRIHHLFNVTQVQDPTHTWTVSNASVEMIPEPSTLGLVAAVGAGVLFVRRVFVI